MSASVNAILVDDEARSDYIQGVISTARGLGLEIHAVDEDDIDSAVSRYSPDVLILDAKIKRSPRQLARRAVRLRPKLAIFFWTGFAVDDEYEELRTSLNPLICVDVGIKVPRADTSQEILKESLVTPVRALAGQATNRGVWRLREGGPAKSEIFQMSVDNFNGLPIRQARDLVAQAHEEVGEVIHQIFSYSEAEWLLMAGPDIDVIRWGATLANMPDSRRILELGRRFGYMPLLFTRPIEVDEIDISRASRAWSECPPGDFYPCLGIDFSGSSTSTQQVHLDTGASKTLLSMERLQEAGVLGGINPIDIRPGERGLQKFQYVDREVAMLLSDGGEATALTVRTIIVFDWDQCPFSRLCQHGNCPGTRRIGPSERWMCGRREVGLLGRDVLIEGRLRIVLDGAERKTRFLRREDERGKPRRRPWRDG